jgi:hypothetical protein
MSLTVEIFLSDWTVSQVSPRVQTEIFFVKLNVVDGGDILYEIGSYHKYHLERR